MPASKNSLSFLVCGGVTERIMYAKRVRIGNCIWALPPLCCPYCQQRNRQLCPTSWGTDHQIWHPSWTSWHREPLVLELSLFCVFQKPFRNWGTWLAAFRKRLEKGALDLISAWFAPKWDINADLWIHTWEQKQQKGIIQDLSIALLRAYPFSFRKRLFSILKLGFSKTNPPQFLNNKYVCITK